KRTASLLAAALTVAAANIVPAAAQQTPAGTPAPLPACTTLETYGDIRKCESNLADLYQQGISVFLATKDAVGLTDDSDRMDELIKVGTQTIANSSCRNLRPIFTMKPDNEPLADVAKAAFVDILKDETCYMGEQADIIENFEPRLQPAAESLREAARTLQATVRVHNPAP
ncbi:MAG: hypothetical protein KJ667_03390, partial [Alphaproteobacteria bacterium]|nr:hypothetical protein [Alphaproteobacteria bacterium]